MEWFIFALLAPALFSISNVIDKFVLSKYIKNPFCYPALLGCIHLFFALLIYTFLPISFVFPVSIFAMSVGLAYVLLFLFYAKLMMVEEASRVITFVNLRPLFVIVLAILFLKEILTPLKYVGIFSLVASAILISCRKVKGKKLSLILTLKFLLPLPLIAAITDVMEKYFLNFMDYWSLYFWGSLGLFVFGISLLSVRTIRRELVKVSKLRTVSLVFGSELISALAILSFYVALSLGTVSLVSAFTSLSPFFLLVYTIILSIFLPRILKEEITKQTILLKFIAVALIFLGTYMIFG